MPRVLLGTTAYNHHIQQIALALHEAGALGGYYTGSVDQFEGLAGWVRNAVGRILPPVDRLLRHRQIADIPSHLIHPNWGWEGLRSIGSRLGMPPDWQDWLWERGEHELDRRCANLLRQPKWDAFLGAEHGCLATLRVARLRGQPSIVTFLSPHHATRARLVDAEYQRFPHLARPSDPRLLRLAARRDERRDAEAREATWILTNSQFTTRSFLEAGFDAAKLLTVPLGSPPALSLSELPSAPPLVQRFIYAGPLSVRKGAHYLLEAWAALNNPAQAELHLYGTNLLPEALLRAAGPSVIHHGSVSQAALFNALREGAILVFPSLCDGFGMVATEALAQGLPVLTTPNAGVADLIVEGENGFLVPPADAEALAARLHWCLANPSSLFAMRPAALHSAAHRAWVDFRADLRRALEPALGLPLLQAAP